MDQLDTQMQTADVVVAAIALSASTRGIVKSGLMKPDAVLVNISRGPVVEWSGSRAAVLDVFDQEPLGENSPLWDAEDVIVTPHNAFVGDGNGQRLWNMIRENIVQKTDE